MATLLIFFFMSVTLVGYISLVMSLRFGWRKAPATPEGFGPLPERLVGSADPATSSPGGWTALDELQLVRLLSDSASS